MEMTDWWEYINSITSTRILQAGFSLNRAIFLNIPQYCSMASKDLDKKMGKDRMYKLAIKKLQHGVQSNLSRYIGTT